ncbi:MAG: hypothetical protein GF401_09945 [Chitinivibrionales bacterium]|nr:hypothetical protein [Chitinivibrionales bacterium]
MKTRLSKNISATKLNKTLCITSFILLIFLFTLASSGAENIPWTQRHFHNVPRIDAQLAFSLVLNGVKVLIIGTPANIPFEKSHVCGAIKVMPHQITRINTKKVPKENIVLCY